MLFKKNNLLLVIFYIVMLASFSIEAEQFRESSVEKLQAVSKKDSASQQIIELRPLTETQLAERYYGEGIKFADRGEREKALQQLHLSLKHDKTNPDAVVVMSKLYFKDEKHTEAIRSLSLSLRYNLNHAGIVTQLAHHYAALQQYKKMVEILSSRTGTIGTDMTISALLAYAYIQTNNYKLATTIYLNLLTIHPNKISWQLGKAIGLEGGGDFEQALSSYVDLKSRFSLTAEMAHFVNLKIVSLYDQRQLN